MSPQSPHHNMLAMSALLRGWMEVAPPLCLCPRSQRPRAATAPPAPPTAHLSMSAPWRRRATGVSASPTCPPILRTPRSRCHFPRCMVPRWALVTRRTSTATGEQSAPTSDSTAQSWSGPPCPVIGPCSPLWSPNLMSQGAQRTGTDMDGGHHLYEACATHNLFHQIKRLLLNNK